MQRNDRVGCNYPIYNTQDTFWFQDFIILWFKSIFHCIADLAIIKNTVPKVKVVAGNNQYKYGSSSPD